MASHEIGRRLADQLLARAAAAGPGRCVTCGDFALRRDLGRIILEDITADATAGRTAVARVRAKAWRAADRTLRAQLKVHRLTDHDADDPAWIAEWGTYADTETATEGDEE